ncbi:MAG TPA: acyl carrier protein [Acidimicrobiales bacterium]|jgi:acyl carrier protein|nr:acyl carrier protein [Acidimicrobiales bacterium]
MSTIELTENPIYVRLHALAVDVLDLRDEQVVPDAHFADDLGADSLDLVELVEALEQEFEVTIDDEELADIATIGEAYGLLVNKLS